METILKKVSVAAVSLILTLALIAGNLFVLPAKATYSAVWPTEERFQTITTYFSEYRNTVEPESSAYHNAIDIMADSGTNIYAAYGGTVSFSGWKDGYGYIVVLYHPEIDVYTFYAHASSLIAYQGAYVSKGDVIALVGSTGQSTGPHLHFGICSDITADGWPKRTYYDPLTFFAYGGGDNNNDNSNNGSGGEEPEECDCSEEYAGVYTTNGVETVLNIRSGHGSSYAKIGEIPPKAIVNVTKSDGLWAHVEYNEIEGFCSMEYLRRVSDAESGMTIENASYPEGNLPSGKSFSIRGIINSELPIAKVWGGVYAADGETEIQCEEAAPDSLQYNLASYFDRNIIFSRIEDGNYIFRIKAEDINGEVFELVNSAFSIGETQKIKGDVNCDGEVNVADAVILESILLNKGEYTAEQLSNSDINNDGCTDVFDLVMLKKIIAK